MTSNALDPNEILLRLGLAFLAGTVVGLERESHGRATGPKTMSLVSSAACMVMIMAQQSALDQAHMGAGILTGMGFLGAGSIVRHDTMIRGLTTAALLWYIAVVGLIFGTGHIRLGMTALSLCLFIIFALPYIERRVKEDCYVKLMVVLAVDGPSEPVIRGRLRALGLRVTDTVATAYDSKTRERTVSYAIELKRQDAAAASDKVVKEFAQTPGVLRIDWSEI